MSFLQPGSPQTFGSNPYTLLHHVSLPDPDAKARALVNQQYLKDKNPQQGTVWEAE